jgi:hypothetical protein
VICDHASHDTDVVLSLDQGGQVVGVTVLDAVEVEPDVWLGHPDRPALPEDLRQEMDAWFKVPVESRVAG